MAQCFAAAGLPKGLVNVVTGKVGSSCRVDCLCSGVLGEGGGRDMGGGALAA